MRNFPLKFLFVLIAMSVLFNIEQLNAKTNETVAEIIILGDSLTAGYGLALENSFPAKLQKRFDADNCKVKIYNAGVSGDTTRAGLERLDWAMGDFSNNAKKKVLIVALGGNDGLRGVDPNNTKNNLVSIIDQAKQSKYDPEIGLIGMYAPPNMGPDYADEFNPIFPNLSKKYDTPLFPFFLEGVLTNKELSQADGIHPNEAGIDLMVKNTYPFFKDFLDQDC